jgi:hypothetical protein
VSINKGEGDLSPDKASIFILACLEKINSEYFKDFGLDQEA